VHLRLGGLHAQVGGDGGVAAGVILCRADGTGSPGYGASDAHESLDVPRALLEDEITPEVVAPFLHGSTVTLPGEFGEVTLRLRGRMEQAGFVFVGEIDHMRPTPRDASDFLMRIDAIVDDAIAREMTRIAVNFLAVTVGYDFVMREEFRPMRKYARYGEPCLPGRVHTFARSIELERATDMATGTSLRLTGRLPRQSSSFSSHFSTASRIRFTLPTM
jgi:hypothetical protein